MIIGISGLAGSGKDTTADLLVESRQCVKVSIADPLKRICKEVFDFTDEQLWGPSEKRNEPDKRYPIPHPEGISSYSGQPFRCNFCDSLYDDPHRLFLTPRYALQQLGTEWGRHCYDDVWVDYALRVANKLLDPTGRQQPHYTAQRGLYYHGLWDPYAVPMGIVIPDVRFRNEVDGIKKAGGKLIRILRPEGGLAGAAAAHRSETEQTGIDDEEFDVVIHNDKPLEALQACTLRVWEALTTGVWPEPSPIELG